MSVWTDIDSEAVSEKKIYKTSKSPEEVECEARYKFRIQLVGAIHSDPQYMMKFIRDNEQRIRKIGFSDTDLRDLRRSIGDAARNAGLSVSSADMRFIDRLFGAYTKPTPTNILSSTAPVNEDPFTMSIDRQLSWFYETTYETFWKWVTMESTKENIIQRPDLKEKFRAVINNNVRMNHVMFEGRREYKPEDDKFFRQLLNEIPDYMEGY